MDFKTFKKSCQSWFRSQGKQIPNQRKIRHWFELWQLGQDYEFTKTK